MTDQRYDLGTTDPYKVPDMIGEPLTAWRAWKLRVEMRDFVVPPSPDEFFLSEDGVTPPPPKIERRPFILLDSVNQGFTWEPRQVMKGVCKAESNPKREKWHEDSEVPMEDCSCGIHALASPLFLAKTGYVSMIGPGKADFVWGEIAMWGKIIQGTTGIKAQYAYPKELFLRPDAAVTYKGDESEIYLGLEELKEILPLQYGIPVQVARTVKRPDPQTEEIIFKLIDGTQISKGGGK